jgi:hypothetical protein
MGRDEPEDRSAPPAATRPMPGSPQSRLPTTRATCSGSTRTSARSHQPARPGRPAEYEWRAVASAVQMISRGLSLMGGTMRRGGRLGAVQSAAARCIRPGSASVAGLWVVVFGGPLDVGPGRVSEAVRGPPPRHSAMTVWPGTGGSHWRSRPGAVAVGELGWRTCGAGRRRLGQRGLGRDADDW